MRKAQHILYATVALGEGLHAMNDFAETMCELSILHISEDFPQSEQSTVIPLAAREMCNAFNV